MKTKYVVNESTLTEIADAIRYQEESTEAIPMEDFARHVAAIEPSIEAYMRITDLVDYPKHSNEANYTKEEVALCTELYTFYLEMEDTING